MLEFNRPKYEFRPENARNFIVKAAEMPTPDDEQLVKKKCHRHA